MNAMHAAPFISLVISTYNRPDALQAAVEACFAQTDRNFEIIITDDGSTGATRACVDALMARAPVPMQHIWQDDKGFRLARARNLGILASRGPYLVFLDGDCVPQRDFIAQHRKLAQCGHIVTGSRILLDQALTERILAEGIDLSATGAGERLGFRLRGQMNKLLQTLVRLPDVGRVSQRFSWRRIKGCNMAMWRCDLDTVGGFDESFCGWGHEDSDLVVRMFNAGIMRKDGAFATEVFHLWHREAQRDHATSNKHLVLARAANKSFLADQGLHTPSEQS
jgi:glycosyltransferase involved in cell wall biosynthesis